MVEDEKIILACKKRKHKGQMALFDKYSPMLKSVCYRYVNNDFDADEILQESFIKIFNNIPNYQIGGSFVYWLKKITANTAITFCKKNNKLKFDELNENHSDEFEYTKTDSFEEKLEKASIDRETIFKHISLMPDGYRLVFNLYVIESFSHKEIAEQLNISINTSKSQLSRAKKYLEKQLTNIIDSNEEN